MKPLRRSPFYLSPLALVFSLLAVPLVAAAAETRSSAPPNIVIFLADDAGWGDYGINGNKSVRTPNIDSIGRDGAQFDRFFVCSVCAPTRAEFLTGRYHPRGGVRGVSTGLERLNIDEKTIADAFKARGYATGAFGKWHNGSQWPYHPQARGFDEYYGHTAGHWGEYFDPPLEHNGKMIRDRGYIVDLCTNRSLAFIEKNRAKPASRACCSTAAVTDPSTGAAGRGCSALPQTGQSSPGRRSVASSAAIPARRASRNA
jgi:arylsulfatase A-like enzyme